MKNGIFFKIMPYLTKHITELSDSQSDFNHNHCSKELVCETLHVSLVIVFTIPATPNLISLPSLSAGGSSHEDESHG